MNRVLKYKSRSMRINFVEQMTPSVQFSTYCSRTFVFSVLVRSLFNPLPQSFFARLFYWALIIGYNYDIGDYPRVTIPFVDVRSRNLKCTPESRSNGFTIDSIASPDVNPVWFASN